jgi:hypothetical protein
MDALDAPIPSVVEPDEPVVPVPRPEPGPKKRWWVGIPIWGWIILALIPIGLIVGSVAAATNPNDDDKPVWDAGTAYEGCREAIENRGGSAPDLFGDFGISLDAHVGNTYEFTVNHRYSCRVTRRADGKVAVTTSGG